MTDALYQPKTTGKSWDLDFYRNHHWRLEHIWQKFMLYNEYYLHEKAAYPKAQSTSRQENLGFNGWQSFYVGGDYELLHGLLKNTEDEVLWKFYLRLAHSHMESISLSGSFSVWFQACLWHWSRLAHFSWQPALGDAHEQCVPIKRPGATYSHHLKKGWHMKIKGSKNNNNDRLYVCHLTFGARSNSYLLCSSKLRGCACKNTIWNLSNTKSCLILRPPLSLSSTWNPCDWPRTLPTFPSPKATMPQ